MTRDIVEHILQMKFDNQQFESNVKTTLDSLDNLKESLSFSGSESKGLAMLESNVAAISDRFSALGIVAATVLQRIADKAVDVGSQILKSLTVEGAMDGFKEYELKLDSIQTIMAGTGDSLETVSAYLDELNTYADKTIYSFSDMTSSIGKFTNAGVGLEDAVRAIQGVSNEAALSGANAQQASHAMYNFAQALASGAVKLIDWKSIETANMATKEFKEQLIATALELGTVVRDGDKYVSTTTDLKGSVSDAFDAVHGFNDSLSAQWMTTDVLVKTLGIYADETTNLGKRAFAAAQDVKTFTQLVDTLKEAAGSGWAQSFEIIIGNFDEAKELWTAVNNELSAIVDRQSQMRNDLLQGWKDAGGRDELIGGLRNIWRAVVSYVTPIKEAFQDIFPAIGSLRLAGLSEQFRIFTSHLKLGDEASTNLKNTFSGLFSILDVGKQAFEAVFRVVTPVAPHLANLADTVLRVTGRIGEYVTQIVKSARENDVFYNALNRVAEVFKTGFVGIEKALSVIKPYLPTVEDFSNLLGWLAEKVEPLANLFDSAKESVSGFFSSFQRNGEKDSVGLFGKILEISGQAMQAARQVMSFLGGVFQKIGTVFSDIFTGLDFARVTEFLNTFMTVGIGAGIIEFIHSLSKITSGAGGFVKSLTGILDGVTGSLEALQLKVKAEALMPVAGAVAILTASLIALSAVDPAKLSSSLSALTTMFIQLGAFMAVFVKIVNGIDDSGAGNETQSIGDKIKNMVTGILGIGGGGNDDKLASAAKALMMISGAVVILSAAMALLSGLSWEEIAKGLVSVAGLMAALTASAMFLSKSEGKLIKGASGLVLFAAAVELLAGAVAKMAALNWEQLAVGLAGTGGLMLELAAFLKLADFDGIGLTKGLGLIALAEALKIMSSAVQSMGTIDFDVIVKGIIGIGSVLLEVGLFSMMMEGVGNFVGIGAGMAVIAASMFIFSNAISSMGSLDMEVIAKGLMTMGTALLLIGAATAMMPATMPLIGTGLVIFAEGLLIVNSALQQIGQMSWDELTKGLMTLVTVLFSLTAAVNLMNGALAGAAAMIVVAGAVTILSGALQSVGAMSWEGIAKSLIALAGAFTIIGVAALVLTPVVPTILALGAGITLLGVGTAAAGAGLTLLAAALVAVSAGGAAAATALGAAVTIIIVDIVALIPTVAEAIGRGFIKIVDVIGDGAVSIGAAFAKIGTAILDVLEELVPRIIYVAIEIISAFLSGISAALPDIVLSALAIIAGFLEGIAMGLPAVVQAAFNLILAFINTMAEAVRFNDGDLLAAVGNLVSSIIELILSALQAVVQGIPVFGQQISDALEGAKSKVHETLAPESFYKMGEDAGSAAGEGFHDRSDKFVQAADDMTEAGLSELTGGEGDYKNTGGKLGGALEKGLSSMSGIVEGAGETLGISGLNGLSMTGKYGDLGEESGLSYILRLSSTEGTLDSVSTSLAGVATGNLSDALGTYSLIGNESGSNYVSEIASYNDDAAAEGSSLCNSVTDSLSDGLETYASTGDSSAEEYISNIESNEPDAESAGRNLAGSAEQGLESRTDEIQNEGDKAGTGYSHSLSARSGEAKNAGTALADSAVQGAKSKKGEFTTAGENAGSGFLSGLGSLLGSIRSKASELASAALNAFRGTLDEHSPSKETEKSGKNFDSGFIRGIEYNADEVENTVANVAENVLKTMSETPEEAQKAGEQFARDGWIDGMVKGLETGAYILQTAASEAGDSMISAFSESVLPSDFTFSADEISGLKPVVTPVLDLDELRTNANEIGDIFRNRQTIRLKNYADIVEGVSIDMAEFDADNRNIIEALKTLHRDMEELRDEVGQTQIVLDTGVLVGEMAGPMDAELGRRYDWEGRGM